MAQAKKDNNRVNAMTAILDSDGETIVRVTADPTTHGLDVSDGTSGSDLTGDDALRDENRVTALIAVSSSDGETPVPIYATSGGHLLVKST